MLRTTKETATRFRVKETTLEQWRWNGRGPKYIKLGRCVRYRDEDLDEFERTRLFASTTEAYHAE